MSQIPLAGPRAAALAVLLALPLAACGGGGEDDFSGEVEESDGGVFGQVGAIQEAVEGMEEAAQRPPAEPVNFRVLRDLLPAEVGGVAQGEVEGATDAAMGVAISQVEAVYPGPDGVRYDLRIMDYGAMPSLAMMGLGWTMAEVDREAGSTYERTVTLGGHKGFRSYDSEAQSGEFSLLVAERFHVEASGTGVSDDDLEAALRAVDLRALAGLRDEGRPEA